MKFTTTEIILTFLLLFMIVQNNNLRNEKINQTNIIDLASFIQHAEKKGPELVIIFTSGPVYNSQQEIVNFSDAVVIEELKKKLALNQYSIISINTPCLAAEGKCLDDFGKLALEIASLKPKAIVYKGIDQGVGSQAFTKVMASEGIPIYAFGTRVDLQHNLYTGPDNENLGLVAFEALENEIRPGQKAVYVETVRNTVGYTINDNGFPRIDPIRKFMTKAGVIEVDTIFSRWSEKITYDSVTRILRDTPDIDYIVVPSVETAIGAVLAVESKDLDVKIIVLDYSPDIHNLLENKRIYAAVSQGLLQQANILYDKIEDPLSIRKKQLLPLPYLITKETLKQFEPSELW